MAEAHSQRSVRFDRRRAMIPVAETATDFRSFPSDERSFGALALVLALFVVLLGGALGYGYVLYSDQQEALAILRQGVSDRIPANGDNVSSGETGQAERDQLAAALGLARQRIAALQAELGAAATGQSELAEPLESAAGQDLDTLVLEVRLLRRERDAAREQIDRLVRSRDALEADLARAEAELAQLAAASATSEGANGQ